MILSEGIQRNRLALIVEDQQINQEILEAILEDDYDVIFASNGVEALEAIRCNIRDLSIILLDLVMPVMDGFEVLEALRQDPELSRIPVIVMTAEEDAELRALQLGAADFITKPFDQHEVILARVGRIIELSEGRQLIEATEHDPLTKLYTRGFFMEYANQISRYHSDWDMDAVVLDIDRFHTLNDLCGREFGDRVLQLIGDQLKELLAGTEGIASRLSADRFALYCKHSDAYQEMLETIQSKVDGMSSHASIRLRMGVCPWAGDMGIEEMFDRAKTACNMVRGSFKNHLMVYDEEMHERELYLQRLLNDLHQAVEERQFVVYFQPKYAIQHDVPKLASAEALVRWNHPELGMISPGDFIPLFEQSGLIHVVDNYVWSRTIEQIAAWRDKFNMVVPVSVNVSRAEVFDPMLEHKLISQIEKHGLSTNDLKLEITESAYTDEAERLIDAVNHLRERGFQIEMDDFGSGYSSLNMISSLPIDVLKLDMRFIQNVESDTKTFRMVELVLDIAQYLNVPVVAEGVETEDQMGLLKKAGCDYIQGYYFSPPRPAETFEELILREKEQRKETQQ